MFYNKTIQTIYNHRGCCPCCSHASHTTIAHITHLMYYLPLLGLTDETLWIQKFEDVPKGEWWSEDWGLQKTELNRKERGLFKQKRVIILTVKK